MSYERLPNGLIQGYEYLKDENGRINWKAHLNVKWLRVKDDKKAEVEKRYGKSVRELDLSTVEDYYLYVTLGGYNEVARLRGFDSLTHSVDYVDGQKAVVTCTIRFVPNVEEPSGLTCAGVASGSIYNIQPDFAPFMETIAENRAFVRAVRRALNINIVGAEELGKGVALPTSPTPDSAQDLPETASLKPYAVLEKRCRELGVSFESLKGRSIASKTLIKGDAAQWTDWKDIEKGDVWTLLEKVNEPSGAAPIAK